MQLTVKVKEFRGFCSSAAEWAERLGANEQAVRQLFKGELSEWMVVTTKRGRGRPLKCYQFKSDIDMPSEPELRLFPLITSMLESRSDIHELSSEEKLLLILFLCHSDEFGRINTLGQSSLIKLSGLKLGKLRASLEYLVNTGLIGIVPGSTISIGLGKICSRYWLNLWKIHQLLKMKWGDPPKRIELGFPYADIADQVLNPVIRFTKKGAAIPESTELMTVYNPALFPLAHRGLPKHPTTEMVICLQALLETVACLIAESMAFSPENNEFVVEVFMESIGQKVLSETEARIISGTPLISPSSQYQYYFSLSLFMARHIATLLTQGYQRKPATPLKVAMVPYGDSPQSRALMVYGCQKPENIAN